MAGILIEFNGNRVAQQTMKSAFEQGVSTEASAEHKQNRTPVSFNDESGEYCALSADFIRRAAAQPATVVRYVSTEAIPAAFRPSIRNGSF